jgi:hypothetical protein
METTKKATTEATENKEATTLKVWNEAIEVKVEIDAIAAKLKASFGTDYPHANLMTNTIMGLAMKNGKGDVGFIYNALSGWSAELNFAKGQYVAYNGSKKMNYHHLEVVSTDPEVPSKWQHDRNTPIIGGRIVKVNEYRDGEKAEVAYVRTDSDGKPELTTEWLNHRELTLIEEDNATMMNAIDWTFLEKYTANRV